MMEAIGITGHFPLPTLPRKRERALISGAPQTPSPACGGGSLGRGLSPHARANTTEF